MVVFDTLKVTRLEEYRLTTYSKGSIVVVYGASIGKLCQLGVDTTVNQRVAYSSFKDTSKTGLLQNPHPVITCCFSVMEVGNKH